MGLLGKIGRALVEEVPTEDNFDTPCLDEDVDTAEVQFEYEEASVVIDDVYAQNGLEDRTQSIFKVEELINSLPKEMVTETKRNSVLSILSNFGLGADTVIQDGIRRTEVLEGVRNQMTDATNTLIEKNQGLIEGLKQQIAELETEIVNAQGDMKNSNESINLEVSRINLLINFIGGGE